MRPVLKPSLNRIWRSPTVLQIGLDRDRALLVSGCDAAGLAALEPPEPDPETDDEPGPGGTGRAGVPTGAAGGGLHGTDRTGGAGGAGEGSGEAGDGSGGPPADRTLVALLRGAGLIDDTATAAGPVPGLGDADRDRIAPDLASVSLLTGAPDGGLGVLAARREQAVAIDGAERVGAVLALLLAAAGVGTVDVRDRGRCRPHDCVPGGLTPDQVGRCRGDAVRERLAAYPTATTPADRPPDLVVLADGRADDPVRRAELLAAGLPHLPATVRETTGVVGALVLPGRSACLQCLDLHRTDRDPGWAAVAVHLSAPDRTAGRAATEACDAVLACAVASCAAREVLTLLDGLHRPATVDGTLELNLPDWRWRRRSWSPHPGCGCLDRPRAVPARRRP